MRHAGVRRFVPILALLAAGACGPVPEEEPAAETAAAAAPAADLPAHAKVPASFKRTASGGVRDTGDFVVRYARTRNQDYRELESVFKETRLFEETVDALNEEFALPADVPVVMRECGEVNAFYDPDAGEISLCYELVEHYAEIFMADAQTDEEQEEAGASVASATMFTFFHEMGHALISIYDLPVTGKEEDAVDDFATLVLINAHEEKAAASAISHFGTLADEYESGDSGNLAFWDEHSLNAQRVYSIACLLYGSDPESFATLVGDDGLPEERAARCPDEYRQKSRAWDKLLGPHLANP